MSVPANIKELRAYLKALGLFPRAIKGEGAIKVNVKNKYDEARKIHDEIAGMKWSVGEMDDTIEIYPTKHIGLVFAAKGWQQRVAATNCKSW